MRDLMALTERPEVISLAGGWPDTSTFPADSYAAPIARVAWTRACALQYGNLTQVYLVLKQCIQQVMAAEGIEIDCDEPGLRLAASRRDGFGLKDAARPWRRHRLRGPHLSRRRPDLRGL